MLSEAENLFKVNWFATGNKVFLRQLFRNAQGNQEFKVVLNSDGRSGDEAKQKGFKVRIFLKRENLIILKLK